MMKALPPAMSNQGGGLAKFIKNPAAIQKAMDIPASQQTIDISATDVTPKPIVKPKVVPQQNLVPDPVAAMGVDPKTGEYLSKEDRVKIFKERREKRRAGIDPDIPEAGKVEGTESLKDSGLGENETKKNVDKKLEDDFEIDPKMKKAFSEALALPAKSAAVALVDLLEKIPAPSKEASKILNRNMTKIANAFKLGAASTEVANDEEDNDEDGDEEYKPTLLQALIGKALNRFGGGDSEEGGSSEIAGQIGGSSPSQPLLPAAAGDPATGKRAPYTGTADGIGLGDGSSGSRAMQPIKKRKGLAKKLFGMTPLGMAFNAGNKMFKGAKALTQTKAFNNITNIGKKAFSMTPMGMGLKFGMKAFGGVKNIFNPPDAPQQSLTELTDKTIQENREAADAKTQKSIETASGTGDAVAAAAGGGGSSYQQEGGELAQPNIEESPFINVYNTTSQF